CRLARSLTAWHNAHDGHLSAHNRYATPHHVYARAARAPTWPRDVVGRGVVVRTGATFLASLLRERPLTLSNCRGSGIRRLSSLRVEQYPLSDSNTESACDRKSDSGMARIGNRPTPRNSRLRV